MTKAKKRERERKRKEREREREREREKVLTCRSQLLKGPWSPLSITVENIRLPNTFDPPPNPSLKFIPARGPKNKKHT